MKNFSGLYVGLVAVSCATTLAFAAVQKGDADTKQSPYSAESEKLKEERIEAEYFGRKNIPGVNVLDGEDGNKASDISDGLSIESISSPSPKDAETPMDPHVAAAQSALKGEVTTAGVESLINKEMAESAVGNAGEPDNVSELAADVVDRQGLGVKPELTAEQVAKNKALAMGFSPLP